ncbi:NADH-quinone oxidoreductase subunit L [Actinomadura rudentiformis]|uniref:NADH-quinone oxidoreductase subunit L n=1 Tax=Actinomadura rudentiformis TaxID=359158 RepID=A0A6H9YVJ1_9ACTN|nr:NADH-quinone oxidoreductase subunit L [Actinomadura rudentiformis]KAB2351089.1 NADH-quinone oxidoreductase subunit L [Actinomadura rudentiformis]
MEAEGVQALAWLLIALPLAGAAILLLGGRRTDKWGHLLGVLMSVGSFVVGAVMFVQMLGYGAEERRRTLHLWEFFDVGSFKVDMGLLVDPLSISFVLLITGVGSLIHIYSIGYMAHDQERRKFFAYLNLFVAAMLLLVLGDNYVAMFIGWEGVGLASYLLIGFWQYKPTAATAAKKAFVVNRVGDFGLVAAIMLMFATFGTVSFDQILGTGAEHVGLASKLGTGTATAIGLLLLLGACGKSAQLPLQSWLLDAMEGPTPVSALIHAATMVTAGVYLIVRSAAIFEMSETAQLVVTIVGAATLLAGAIIGTGKDDIKKALAGSTMSQIGYMHLAAGLGKAGYAFAIAHLIAHGFFKAGLFLGAGSVMHGMKDDVNMRHYGALRSMMVLTWATFGLGYLAIIGFPGLSGWFTKDGIIEAAFEKGGTSGMILGACALLGAGITAYYMSRVMFMTFYGEKRWDEDAHPHESPKVMTVPLMVLAVGSVFAGGFLILGGFSDFLAPVVGEPEHHGFKPITGPGIATFVLMLIGVGIAWRQYGARPVPREAPKGSFVTVAARKDLYGDALNESLLMRPGQWLTRLAVWFDNRGVDGAVNGLAAGIGGTSGRVRRVQTGFARSYALSMFFGAALVVAALLVVNV